jgi:hypothetical protein
MIIDIRNVALLGLIFVVPGVAVSAAPTPIPGGANQVNAIDGKVGDTIFNGVLRITVQTVRDATADDHPEKMLPGPNQKVMVMNVSLRNGTHSDFIDLLSYSLADTDDVVFQIPSNWIIPGNLHIIQGAAARQNAMFLVDKDYKPTKLIIQCGTCSSATHFRSLRLTIPQSS